MWVLTRDAMQRRIVIMHEIRNEVFVRTSLSWEKANNEGISTFFAWRQENVGIEGARYKALNDVRVASSSSSSAHFVHVLTS